MSDSGQDRGRGFKVSDRRRFSETGEARDESEATPRDEPETAAPQASPAAPTDPPPGEHQAPLQITFASFIVGLTTQALADLGDIPSPAGSRGVDLEAARQIIDILAVLQQKTRGNLDPTESQLLEQALYDLRVKFVEHSR